MKQIKKLRNRVIIIMSMVFSLMILILPSVSSQTQLLPNATNTNEKWNNFPQSNSNVDGLEIRNNEMFGIGSSFGVGEENTVLIGSYGTKAATFFARLATVNFTDVVGIGSGNKGLWMNDTHFIWADGNHDQSWTVATREGVFVTNVSADTTFCSDIDERTLTSDGVSNIVYVSCADTGQEIVAYTTNGTGLGSNITTTVVSSIYGNHWSPTFQRWYIGTGDNDTLYELDSSGVPTGLEATLNSPDSDANFIAGIADDGEFIYVSNSNEEIHVLNPTSFNDEDNIPVTRDSGTRGITVLNGVTYAVNDNFHSNEVWTINSSGGIATRAFSTHKDGLTRSRGIGSDATHLYISDDTLDTINQYLPNGSLIQSFSFPGASLRNLDFAADTGNFWFRLVSGARTLLEHTSSFVATGLSINVSSLSGDPNAFAGSIMIRDGIIYAGSTGGDPTQKAIYRFDTAGNFLSNFYINLTGNQDEVGDYGTDGTTVWVRNAQNFDPFNQFVVTYPFSEWSIITIPPTITSIQCDYEGSFVVCEEIEDDQSLLRSQSTCLNASSLSLTLKRDNVAVFENQPTTQSFDIFSLDHADVGLSAGIYNLSALCTNDFSTVFSEVSFTSIEITETESFQRKFFSAIPILAVLMLAIVMLVIVALGAKKQFGRVF